MRKLLILRWKRGVVIQETVYERNEDGDSDGDEHRCVMGCRDVSDVCVRDVYSLLMELFLAAWKLARSSLPSSTNHLRNQKRLEDRQMLYHK